MAHMNEQLDFHVAPDDVNGFMKPPETDVAATGNRLRNHDEIENLPEDLKVIQTGQNSCIREECFC